LIPEMKTRLIIPLLVAGALAFACGPRSRSEPANSVASAQPVSATPVAPSASSSASRNRRKDSAAAKARAAKLDSHLKVDVGEKEVRFALDVTNVGGKHAEVDFPSGQSYDFVVVDTAGHEVWQWSNGRMFTQTVQNKQLAGGESMQVAEHWKAKSGRYTAIATLRSSNYPVEQRAEFVVK
jgi:hypothetical protein